MAEGEDHGEGILRRRSPVEHELAAHGAEAAELLGRPVFLGWGLQYGAACCVVQITSKEGAGGMGSPEGGGLEAVALPGQSVLGVRHCVLVPLVEQSPWPGPCPSQSAGT